jgi:hypothetical protein
MTTLKKIVAGITTSMCLLALYFIHENGIDFNPVIASLELLITAYISGELFSYINKHYN